MFSWNSHLASYEFTIRLTVRLGAVTISCGEMLINSQKLTELFPHLIHKLCPSI